MYAGGSTMSPRNWKPKSGRCQSLNLHHCYDLHVYPSNGVVVVVTTMWCEGSQADEGGGPANRKQRSEEDCSDTEERKLYLVLIVLCCCACLKLTQGQIVDHHYQDMREALWKQMFFF
eukprot:GHVS01099678.1.p1 GENE.GHVS01099678.1~~GHVS01099678.1.p1  ORF type:complete len:118 (-),score=9.41 GHVS01099678.1:22-375(-)